MLIKSKVETSPETYKPAHTRDYYKARLQIDKDDLDNEVVRHATLFQEVGEEYTRMVSVRDKLKEQIDREGAKVGLTIRAKLKGEKITVDELNARVNLDAAYCKLRDKYIDINNEAAQWYILKDSFHSRRYMIQEMCNLYNSGYWGVKTSGASADAAARKGREGQQFSLRPKTERK